MKVFLGGTCNESTWREALIPMLNIDYFNPVVEDWTPDCMEEEIKQRKTCDYVVYVITPKMTGVYAIAEVVDDSNKRPDKTLFCVLKSDGEDRFNKAQLRSLSSVYTMVSKNGGICVESLEDLATVLSPMTPMQDDESFNDQGIETSLNTYGHGE